MNSGKRYGQQLRRGTIGAILSLASAILGGCDITQPSEDPWSDVSAFSWSTDTLRYHVWKNEIGSAVTDTLVLVGRDSVAGGAERIRVLEKVAGSTGSIPIHTRMRKDTLIVSQGDGPPAFFQLVGPIVVDGIWISQFHEESPGDTPAPAWKARIVGRYGRRKIGAKEYEHVVEVEYRPLLTQDLNRGTLWVRYFAKGIGPVLTKQYGDDSPGDNILQSQLLEEHTLLPE